MNLTLKKGLAAVQQSAVSRRWRAPPYAIAAAFSFAPMVVLAADPAGTAEPQRLSGTVSVSDSVSLAIVDFGESGSRIYRVGDQVDGWGRIVGISEGRIEVESEDGVNSVVLSGGEPRAVEPPEPTPTPVHETRPINVIPTASLLTEISRLSDDPGVGPRDLNQLLFHIEEIPAGAEITTVNGQPIEDATMGPAEILDEMERGNVVSLKVMVDGELQSVYLQQPPQDPEDR